MSRAVKQLMPWFGGDAQSAGAIVEAIGEHTHFVDPFAGGLSVLFAKPRVACERVNDANGELVNLAQVVASEPAWKDLDERLARTVWCDEVYDDARQTVLWCRSQAEINIPPDGHEWAYAAFVVAWMGRGGWSGTDTIQGVSRRNDTGGGWSGTRFRAACDCLAWMHERLRTVEITSIDGIELAGAFAGKEKGDVPGLAIFCDPPFIEEGGAYAHTFDTRSPLETREDDHSRLAAALNGYERARVVVEYHEHPRLEELYPPERWRRVPLETRDQVGNGKRGPKSSVLLVNDGGRAS